MPNIKLHLEQAEYDAVERFAASINVKPEAVVYGALNRLMLESRDPEVRKHDHEVDSYEPYARNFAAAVQRFAGA